MPQDTPRSTRTSHQYEVFEYIQPNDFKKPEIRLWRFGCNNHQWKNQHTKCRKDIMLGQPVLDKTNFSGIITILYNTLQYDTVRYSTISYRTLRDLTERYNHLTAPYNTLQYPTVSHSTLQYPTVPNNTSKYLALPHNTLQSLTIPYKTLQYPTLR